MPWTIYCHTHVESGRRYVGLTSQTMERRWASHVTKAKSSRGGRWHFPNAIRRYGPEAFSHEVLEVCHDLEVANLAEESWIELFDTRNPEKGFNIAKGGQHTPHPIRKNPWDDPGYREKKLASLRARAAEPSYNEAMRSIALSAWENPEIREKYLSTLRPIWQSPEFRERSRDSMTGRKLSPETRAKIANVRRGQKHSEETRQRISQSNRSGDADVREKLRAASTGRQHTLESRQRISDHFTRCSEERRLWTHKICKFHGTVPIEECHVGERPDGKVRIECKACLRERERARRLKGI